MIRQTENQNCREYMPQPGLTKSAAELVIISPLENP
jgi:hypothetical protein